MDKINNTIYYSYCSVFKDLGIAITTFEDTIELAFIYRTRLLALIKMEGFLGMILGNRFILWDYYCANHFLMLIVHL